MRVLGFCFLFLIFGVNDSSAQSTDTAGLSKMVNIISYHLQKNDFASLKKMVKHNEFFTPEIFENMRQVNIKFDYRKLYADSQKAPIYEPEKYILGGHGEGTRHINIELRYINKKWQLYKIWVCR